MLQRKYGKLLLFCIIQRKTKVITFRLVCKLLMALFIPTNYCSNLKRFFVNIGLKMAAKIKDDDSALSMTSHLSSINKSLFFFQQLLLKLHL